MLRLTLIIVLIAATCSAKHVKKQAGSRERIWENCYGANNPFYQCHPRDCTYPVWISLERVRSVEDFKAILIADGNLEKLCREAGAVLDCAINAFDDSPAECQEDYTRQYRPITRELLGNGEDFLSEICEDDIIESARSNLDCIMEENLLEDAYNCVYANRNINCSGLDYNTVEARECYRERSRRNCNADEVVECASRKVTAECDGDAGTLVESLGDAYFNTLKAPVCPDYGEIKNLLKFIKK